MSQKGYKTRQFGKYTLLERIGAGGMAEIFRAKMYGAHGFEKEVAIKKILPHLTDDAEFVEMFIDEAKIMVGLVHNNIVQVFDLGEIDNAYFIGMEFVQGKDLLDLLARCAEMQLKIPLKLGLFIALEMLKGLDYAHKATDVFNNPIHIIHRDVSPSNVLLSYAGDVKVGDFGVAKAATQHSQTESGTLKGKVGYMSPEQVRGDEIDHRSDVFAAGIILFEMLNMRRLFVGGSDLDVMLRVRDVDVDEELRTAVALPKDLDAIVRKALTRDPASRYQSAIDLHDDLLEFLFRNRIRVSNSNLASFLSKVFAKEIEQDQMQRLQFRKKEEALREAARSSGGTLDLDLAVEAADTPPPTEKEEAESYRYRDKSGLVFGPMSAKTLTNLLVGVPIHEDDRVCRGKEAWRRVYSVKEIFDAVVAAKRESGEVMALGAAEKSDNPAKSIVPLSPVLVGEHIEPDEDPIESVIQPPEGQLATTSIARLLHQIWRAKTRGKLILEREGIRKEIFFAEGNPTSVVSNNDSELLGNFLVRERILSPMQLEHALKRADAFGGRLGDALVADRIIQSHVLFEYLFRQAKLKLFDLFTWEDAHYLFEPNSQAVEASYPLGIDSLEVLLEGVKRYMPADLLSALFDKKSFVPLIPAKEQVLHLDALRLTAKQFRIASTVLQGPTNLDMLDRRLTTTPKIVLEDIHRIVFLLCELDLVAFQSFQGA